MLSCCAPRGAPDANGDAGIYAQRTLPGWYGTVAQVQDPAYGTRVFLLGRKVTPGDVASARANGSRPAGSAAYQIPGLVQVSDWQHLTITEAAQKVQRSNYPDAYAERERMARALLAVFVRNIDPSTIEADTTGANAMCGAVGAMNCPATGLSAETGLTPDALRVIRCIEANFPQIVTFGGVGDRPGNVDDDHQTGRAVDAMLPAPWSAAANQALGKQIEDWVVANRLTLGLHYVIFHEQMWSMTYPKAGWRRCGEQASCYAGPNDTQAHRDHVHVSVYGQAAGQTDAAADTTGAVSPVDNYVLTARFGQCGARWKRCHTGLDFAAPTGKPIHAILGGKVMRSGDCKCAYGRLTVIKISATEQVWYAHQSVQTVRVGDTVTTGRVIGQVGATGNVTGPHLHVEYRVKESAQDPEPWLRGMGVLR